MSRSILCLLLGGLLVPSLHGQNMDIALLGAESSSLRLDDVQAKLEATGLFDSVSQLNVYTATPTLNTLLNYDAVLTWSNSSYNNAVLLGDNLADYVDAGGGVVVMIFATTNYSTSHYLQGRWETEGYYVLENNANYSTGTASLGTVYDANHPIMQGVSTFNGGTSSYRSIGTSFSTGAERIADWSDGLSLVAVDTTHETGRVDLNFYPPSNTQSSGYWDSNTDGGRLMGNALEWTTGGGVPDLSFTDVIPGSYLTFHIRRVTPGNPVITLLSHLGAGPTTTPFGIIEVTQPWLQTPAFVAGQDGVVDFTTTLPSGASGRTLYSQAIELIGGGAAELSNAMSILIP